MIGSLFSGIGGLELGLEWAGLGPVAWQVEIDPFCRGVLAMHWPGAKRFADVREVGRDVLSQVDVICGGFPCQDVSCAGKGAGLDGARSGLWREYLRIVGELRPRVVVVENVRALVTRGLDRVATDLDAAGYRVEARIIAAADVGAPHRRERLFLVAHTGPLGPQQRGARHDHDGNHAPGNDPHRRDPGMADTDRPRVRFEQQWMPWGRPAGLRAGRKAEPFVDREAGGRSAESCLGKFADGASRRMDGRDRGGLTHGSTSQGGAGEILRALQNVTCPSEIWDASRRLLRVPSSPLLQHDLLGAGSAKVRRISGRALQALQTVAGAGLPTVHVDRDGLDPPRGREPGQQRTAEPHDALWLVSHAVALATREASATACASELQRLWRVRETVGTHETRDVFAALPAPESDREARGAWGRWPSRPGEPQAPWEPPRSVAKGLRDPTRRPKIAALGNAVVPQVARLVGERVREILGRTAS